MTRPILNYHCVGTPTSPQLERWTISPDDLGAHLDLLVQTGRRGVSLREFLNDPEPDQVALTFDDGFQDFIANAVPELQARGFSATLYVVTGDVGRTASWLEDDDGPMATWEQLRSIDRAGFEVGVHSHSHPNLDLLRRSDLAREVAESRRIVERELGHPVDGFCYPHGFYTRRVRSAVKDAGYSYACGVRHKMSSEADDRFALARIVVDNDTSTERLDQWLNGKGLRPGGLTVERSLAAAHRTLRRAGSIRRNTSRPAIAAGPTLDAG